MCVSGICSQSGRGSMRWNFDTLYKVTELREKKMSNKHISERYEFRNIKQNEAEEAAEIERICFPPNEACSRSI